MWSTGAVAARSNRYRVTHAIAAAGVLLATAEGTARAEQQPFCLPGTPVCVGASANGGVHLGGAAQGRVGTNGANASANGNANANGNARVDARANASARGNANAGGNVNMGGNANAGAHGNAGGNANAGGHVNAGGNVNVNAGANGNADVRLNGGGTASMTGHGNGQGWEDYSTARSTSSSEPTRFGAGVALCATLKVGVLSGYKGGPCFAVSFRTEHLTFEMETQLLFGGTRHSTDWVFPMSFVIPLTNQRSLYEGLQLRVGGSPIGATFAKASDGGSYVRFGLHAGLSYEWNVSSAVSWRVFDARAFLDFGTKREVDLHDNFLDFGAQFSSGIVF